MKRCALLLLTLSSTVLAQEAAPPTPEGAAPLLPAPQDPPKAVVEPAPSPPSVTPSSAEDSPRRDSYRPSWDRGPEREYRRSAYDAAFLTPRQAELLGSASRKHGWSGFFKGLAVTNGFAAVGFGYLAGVEPDDDAQAALAGLAIASGIACVVDFFVAVLIDSSAKSDLERLTYGD